MKLLHISFLLCLPFFAFADLAIAKKSFENGEYDKVLQELEADLFPTSKLGSKESDIEAYKLLGACYLLNKNPDKNKAKTSFYAVLGIDSDATLDTLRFSPEVVEVFNEVKKDIANNLILVSRKTKMRGFGQATSTGLELLKRQKDLTPKYYAVVVQEQSDALSFIPILGQLQNEQPQKAFSFLGVEALFLGTSIGTFIYLQKITDDTDNNGTPECRVEDPNEDRGLSADEICQLARNINLVSASLSLVTLGVAAYDARKNFTPLRYELKEVPPEVGRSLQKQVSQLRIAPKLGFGVKGLELVGNF